LWSCRESNLTVYLGLVAVFTSGALLGIVGALVAIPIAAALQLLTQEVLFPRLDNA
jgi:predicted PurR-regulated permease PerM